MPHLTIEYSANLDAQTSFAALCQMLSDVLLASGFFEPGAIRVRARACPHFVVADNHPKNAFADMILRIGQGRSAADRKTVGSALMVAAQTHFALQLGSAHFALSLEVQEIQSEFSWKTNAIHPRLRSALPQP